MELKTERQIKLIINNIYNACNKDISKLSKAAYEFLYLSSGFIAHYNKYGFINHYSSGTRLKDDILRNEVSNSYICHNKGERDYEYYKQKMDIYIELCNKLKQ